MPIYEYRCSSCGAVFPRLQPVGAGPGGVRCPNCDSETVERLPSVFSSSAGSETTTVGGRGACGPST